MTPLRRLTPFRHRRPLRPFTPTLHSDTARSRFSRISD
ncbi:hypothetical protein LOK49_LG10G01432 [Camellia lanceoleosa]|uniref:Uncharacterized protein n=1 Tax=Camellia lanceoleosa TaxID=1840588 RepID=A0ACC0GAB8_9ERIC|nr:hypothetical protein LOK49_LG10G01432 [Camellia lanceoleosa]